MSAYEEYRQELDQLQKAFASIVKRLREASDCSQEEFAAHAKLHRTEMSKIECGERDPRLSTLLILAAAFKVSVGELTQGLPAPKERRPSPQAKRKRIDDA